MKQHILIVDDEPQMRELLGLYLQRQGYAVSSAANSAETLEKIETKRPALIILDISLADEDGLQLLAKCKARLPETPVIMLTGMGFVDDLLQEAQQKGADGYVSKVGPIEELLLTIRQTIKGRRVAAKA